jgi:intraflagellar transport protein 140
VFCTPPSSSNASTGLNTPTPSFFFGSATGTVSYADDLGHVTDVQQLSSSIDTLLFYADKARLVIITRSLLMTQLQVSTDGRVTPVMKVKLSVAGNASSEGVKAVQWVGNGIIGSVSSESLIRFWDLKNDENYVISLKTASSDTAVCKRLSKEKGTSIAFDVNNRFLSVVTDEGSVCIWKFVGYDGGSSGSSGNDKKGKKDKKDKKYTHASDWKPISVHKLDGYVAHKNLLWSPNSSILAISSNSCGTTMLSSVTLQRSLNNDCAGIQISGGSVLLENKEGESRILDTDMNIKGLVVDDKHCVVWNGKYCQVYSSFGDGGGSKCRQVSDFSSSARSIGMRSDTLFMAIDNRLLITNLQGVQRMSVSFTESEGVPLLVDINGCYLAVTTDRGVIKLYDVSRKEPKALGSSGLFVDPLTNTTLGVINAISINSDGTRLAILSDKIVGGIGMHEPDHNLYVYDSDRDIVEAYDFGVSGRVPTSAFWDGKEAKLLVVESRRGEFTGGGFTGKNTVDLSGSNSNNIFSNESKSPTRITSEDYKDENDANDANDANSATNSTNNNDAAEDNKAKDVFRITQSTIQSTTEIEVTTMFVTSDYGIRLQDVLPLEKPWEMLLGISVPRLYFVKGNEKSHYDEDDNDDDDDDDGDNERKRSEGKDGEDTESEHPTLCSTVMRDFVGLSDVDSPTLTALLDFSYYLTIGNMDAAYRAVKLIKNTTVWENMAHMCVKTKRLDVAEVCLGNMGYARGAAAVRLAKKEPEPEAAIAMVAIQLGLIDDAARLYEECGRFDLLNKLYQGQGEWEKAIEIANVQDRIHLKTTHHQYAKYLETIGDTAGAIRNFERADTYKTEVPRMLFDQQRMEDLEDYIMQGNDTELLKWWAGYCESLGHFEKARRYYARANDDLSLVRVACHNRDMAQAADIVSESNSNSAAYHLARQYEAMGEVQEAITYFSMSGCYNHAIRLSKAYGLDGELMSFALKSRPSNMIDCADYFEKKGEYEKAVQLYQKGGDNARALDLCFRAGKDGGGQGGGRNGNGGANSGDDTMYDVLKSLAENLGENASPLDIERCAEYFINNNQVAKAVEILWKKAKKYDYAIDLCLEHKVKIDDDMAEGLTPPKSDDPVEAERRLETLRKLAKACKKQNVFHLACKKYTQAGERLKAMKCLLKSGDTKNIIYYAGASRNKDIYVLAANYLQSLDWHDDNEIMKNIIQFYTKAKAFEQLASFYEACSQVEIDEYRDYDKALGALREAKKHVEKVKPATGASESMAASLFNRISVVERFVAARRGIKGGDASDAERICKDLLDGGAETEQAIRIGDCYALLVEHFHATRRFDDAFVMMEGMKERGIVLKPYLEADMINDICSAVGREIEEGGGKNRGGGGGGRGDESGDFDNDDDDIGEELDESIEESMGEESDGSEGGGRK